MRGALFLLVAVIALAVGGYGWIRWQSARMFPPVSKERVTLSPEIRYTGTESPEEEARAIAAVDQVIDGVLSSPHALVAAQTTSKLIGRSMRSVDTLPTEDRDRTADYMLEVWYVLGFKGAIGQFAYGKAYPRPPGYAEPLPAGWIAPTKPRPIG
jgi:hypothetical protein